MLSNRDGGEPEILSHALDVDRPGLDRDTVTEFKLAPAEAYVARHGAFYLGADAIAAELCPHNPLSIRIEAGKQFVHRWQLIGNTGESFELWAIGQGDGLVANAPVRFAQFLKDIGESE